MKFWIRVKRDINGKIISLYSPDFDKELLNNIDLIENQHADPAIEPIFTREPLENFREYTYNKLLSLLPSDNQELSPKKRKDVATMQLSSLEHWECFNIDQKISRTFFSKFLPGLGHAFNIISYLTGAFITYMALRIASHNAENTSTSTGLSISGTVFSSTILLLVYIASGTSKALANIGQNIDKLSFCKNHRKNTIANDIKYFILAFFAWGATLAAICITGIRLHQEMSLLAEKYLALDSNISEDQRQLQLNLIKWFIIDTYIISGGYCSVAFQGSYAMKLARRLIEKPALQTDNTPLQEVISRNSKHEDIHTEDKDLLPAATEGLQSDNNLYNTLFDSLNKAPTQQQIDSQRNQNRCVLI